MTIISYSKLGNHVYTWLVLNCCIFTDTKILIYLIKVLM